MSQQDTVKKRGKYKQYLKNHLVPIPSRTASRFKLNRNSHNGMTARRRNSYKQYTMYGGVPIPYSTAKSWRKFDNEKGACSSVIPNDDQQVEVEAAEIESEADSDRTCDVENISGTVVTDAEDNDQEVEVYDGCNDVGDVEKHGSSDVNSAEEGSEMSDDIGLQENELEEITVHVNDELTHSSEMNADNSACIVHSTKEFIDAKIAGIPSQPLYLGAPLSAQASWFSIHRFSLANKLSDAATKQLLDLIGIHCPKPNMCANSLYMLRSRLGSVDTENYYYCSHCKGEIQNPQTGCPNPNCVPSCASVCYFTVLRFISQLKTIVEANWEHMQYPSSLSSSDTIRDIQDGVRYKCKVSEMRSDNDAEHVVGLILSSDGVPLFKSSGHSIWPIQLAITSLPPGLRMNVSNLILAGIWLGPVKPNLEIILKPILEKLDFYSKKGIAINTSTGNNVMKPKLLMCVFDLVARAMAVNTVQFNGYFGCLYCIQEGIYKYSRMLFPPLKEYEKRDKTSMDVWATMAEKEGKPVCGVKGHSILSQYIDIVRDVPIDYMHMILEGINKMLLQYWFDAHYKDHCFYLGKVTDKLDKMLLRIKPPHTFRRSPRSLRLSSSFWKASEHHSWMLYYAVPLLLNILPPNYIKHLSLLITSIHILLGASITQAEIETCRELLASFHRLLPYLYPETLCTANFHMLAHLCDCVIDWGPLWSYSVFGFENLNGYIRTYAHGTGNVLPQIVEAFMMHQASKFASIPTANNEETNSFIQHLDKNKGVDEQPKTKKIKLPIEEINALISNMFISSEEAITTLPSFKKDNVVFISKAVDKNNKRDSSICQISSSNTQVFVSIRRFCLIDNNVIAIADVFKSTGEDIFSGVADVTEKDSVLRNKCGLINNYIYKVKKLSISNTIIAFPANAIIRRCVHVPIKHCETDFIVLQPNAYEHH